MSLEISYYGNLIWRNEKGELHREKGPAFICTDGGIEYSFNDNFHRLDGPAIIQSNGDKYYYIYSQHYTKEDYLAKVKKL